MRRRVFTENITAFGYAAKATSLRLTSKRLPIKIIILYEFKYINNELWCEDISLIEVAEKFGTPLYVYSRSSIIDHCREIEKVFRDVDHLSCYSIKANSNLKILEIIAQEGIGADAGSIGELHLALKAGFPHDKITFSGVGKRDDEIEFALQNDISLFIVESEEELYIINTIAEKLGKVARIQIRINFDISASTHPYISTGEKHNKFGIDQLHAEEIFQKALQLKNIEVSGIHTHIGSQITNPETFIESAKAVVELIQFLRNKNIPVQQLNFGGGFGVQYHDFVKHKLLPTDDEQIDAKLTTVKLLEAALPVLKESNTKIFIQPGRSIIAHTGILLTKVLYRKTTSEKTFIIVDAGMNDLIRPSLYKSYHQISPITIKNSEYEIVDVVGPLCESGDFFALNRKLNYSERGDYLSIFCTGAYGYVLSSNYNGRLRPAEVLIDGKDSFLIRERERIENLTK